MRRLTQGHLHTRRLGGAGIELATFWLPANPLYHLSHMLPRTPRTAGAAGRASHPPHPEPPSGSC